MEKDILRLLENLNTRQKLLTWHIKQIRNDTGGELETIENKIEEDLKELYNKRMIG